MRDKTRERLLIRTWAQDEIDQKRADSIRDGLTWALIVGAIVIALSVLLIGCSYAGELKASWYSVESLKKEGTYQMSHGIMSNGKMFRDNELTCATRLYPLGTYLLITNLNNGKSVTVKVTDRVGKRFAKTRIDLSKEAFKRLSDLKTGLIPIKAQLVTINVK